MPPNLMRLSCALNKLVCEHVTAILWLVASNRLDCIDFILKVSLINTDKAYQALTARNLEETPFLRLCIIGCLRKELFFLA